MGMQPILPITVPVRKIKGVTRQRNVVTLGVNRPLNFDGYRNVTKKRSLNPNQDYCLTLCN